MTRSASRRDHQKLFSVCDQLLRIVDATRERSFDDTAFGDFRKATHHVSMAVQYLSQILSDDEVESVIGLTGMDSAVDRIAERQLAQMERARSPWSNPLPSSGAPKAPVGRGAKIVRSAPFGAAPPLEWAPASAPATPPDPAPARGVATDPAGVAANGGNTLEGDNSTLSIQELVSWFSFQERHGVLRVAIPGEVITIVFEGGTLVHATSNNSPAGSRLGEILVEQGALSAADLAGFLERCRQDSGKHMGAILAEEDTVTRDGLRAALKIQVKRMLSRLFASASAKFILREGKPNATDGLVDLNMLDFLLDEARNSTAGS